VIKLKRRKKGVKIMEEKKIDWEQRRYELAKAAMQGLISNSFFMKNLSIYLDEHPNRKMDVGELIYIESVNYADIMIKKLKGELTMKAYVMKLENNCVIVDEEYFNEIKKQSEFNQERINEIAEEKFLEYVKESGIKLSYEVNGIPYIFHHDLLSELNYEERGYPESVSEKVKHVIADDITEALNDKFKGLKDEALNYALSEFDKRKHGLEATVKIWKHFALIFIITTIILTIRLFLL
jgi:hypothetical protein